MSGEKHTAITHDTINVKQLVDFEQRHPPKEGEKKVPNQYGEEGEDGDEEEVGIPHEREIPPGAIIHREQQVMQNRGAQQYQALSPVPNTNFSGLDDNNTSIPPDVNGAVGPNHLMVTLNTEYRIQSRAGATISTVSMASFWSGLASVSGTFDPKTLYDPFNNRWIAVAVSNSRSAASAVLVAVSQTNDPTGTWNRYKIDATAADTMWLDYPSVGFNKDWIVITGNFFGNVAGGFQTSIVYVLNKANFYSGGVGSYTSINSTNNVFTLAPAITYDNAISTEYLTQTWDGSTGSIQLYTITGAVGSEVLTSVGYSTTTNYWDWGQATGADFAPQATVSNKFQCNDDRMLSCVYRNGAIWCAHTIFLPLGAPTRCSLQWWKLTTSGAVTARDRIDDPTGVNFYAFPSLSVNSSNDALIGYSRFSASTFASAGYSLKLSSDANFQSDYIFKTGLAKYYKTYSGTRNRWGDYTLTQVDPANDNDFWTLQEYTITPSGGYDRWGTWWANVSATSTLAANFTADLTSVCTSNNVTFTSTSTGSITTYAWDFGSGATPATSASAGPVVVQYSTTGLKTITLTITGPAGTNSITKTNYVNVFSPPAAAGTITGSANACQGQNGVAYSVASISGATGYTWTLPTGASIASGANTNSITVNFSASFTGGNISVYGTNAGCSGASSSLAIAMSSLPSKTGNLSFAGSSLTINDNTTATPYPSTVSVSGFTGNLLDVNVSMTLSHTYPDDIDILLESPSGQQMILLSDCGGTNDFINTTIVFNDSASANASDAGAIPAGSYKPTNITSPDPFAAPGPGSFTAPVGSASTPLSIFNGTNPNGTWKLYVVDDLSGDAGSISTWSLKIIGPVPNDAPVITGSSIVCQGQNGVAYSIPVVAGVTGYTWTLPSGASIASGS
ncbi:MAG: proprotein convertase P-domain-containing protein, partial [Bacteroidetes bacterium]|nr:proprotein convertase P-domain-containing protein [Bacteroidota bacterium]